METLAERYRQLAAQFEADGMAAVDADDDVQAVRMFRLSDMMLDLIELRIWEVPGYE